MSEKVAVRRRTLQEARGVDGGRWATHRPSGRRFVLLVVLACASVAAIATSSAQAAGLPDGRAYELVTPPNKDNDSPYLRAGIFAGYQVSADGNAVGYPVLETFPGSQSFGGSFQATRTSGGWTDADVIPPQSTPVTQELCSIEPSMVGYSSDMSKGVLEDGFDSLTGCPTDHPQLVPGEPQGVQNIFVADLTNGTYQLVDVTPSGVTPADATYVGGSSDLSHVVFNEAAQLTSNAPGGGATNLYEWVGGTVSLVTQVPTSGASCTGAACTAAVGSIASLIQPYQAVSADGSSIFFTANGKLYDRRSAISTTQVDASVGGGGQFFAASSDGSKVYFTVGGNLYEYDFSSSSPQPTNLTPADVGAIDGLSGISDDGSYIYFVGHTTSGMTPGPAILYVSHNGATPTMITTLNSGDSNDWSSSTPSARASSNGQFFVFNSTSSLTGFDNTDANTSTPDNEIFLYDATTGSLSCVSCSPSGAAPTGNTNIDVGQTDGFAGDTTILNRYVSDSGQVFFDTPNALLPADTDGGVDTYEYEGGNLSLISSGTDADGALYIDNTPNGSDVLFATTTSLVPQDNDGGAYDIYDARVGGGFPASNPTPPCQGESCKPPVSIPPATPVAGSVTFTGPDNAKSGHAAAKIMFVKRMVKSAKFALRLRVTASGQIVVSGRDIKRVSRAVRHAGTYTVIVHLTSKAKNRLRHKRKLKLSISAQYLPSAGSASTVKVNLTAKA